jgi:hypothetical protein
MTTPTNRNLDRPVGADDVAEEDVIDRLPPSERGQDEVRTEITHDTAAGSSRPLTRDERDAAEHDRPLPDRVYAPASERVPKTVEGHREIIEHTDPTTPERQAVTEQGSDADDSEPTFTRVPRPATTPSATPPPGTTPSATPPHGDPMSSGPRMSSSTFTATSATPPHGDPMMHDARTSGATFNSTMGGVSTPVPTPYASPTSNPAFSTSSPWHAESEQRPMWQRGTSMLWLLAPISAGVGIWMYMRWRAEQNKPINRLRRQARHTAAEIRDHVPSGDDLIQPAMGMLAAMLSTGVMIARQMQQQRGKAMKRGAAAMSDADLQKRLHALKERWNPGRVELEKFSISRHH